MFKSQPNDVTAFSGDSVEFGCDCIEEHSIPSWKIDGNRYSITRLPRHYYFDIQSSSLVITEAAPSMNLSTHQCTVGGVDSSIGILIIVEGRLQNVIMRAN